MKKIISLLLCLSLVGCGQSKPQQTESDRLQIVTTIFPAYDFARAVAGDDADVTMLLPPGTESHSYEPTPADILAVQNCDLFVYLGGESDTWVETILASIEQEGESMRMIDCVTLLKEDDHDHDPENEGLGEVLGMDEHVWTSPENAEQITVAIGNKLAELDVERASVYRSNADAYAQKIDQLDGRFEDFFDTLDDRTIIFGDRFALRYFAEEYDLDYYSAFPGCGTQTEPSAATIAFLTKKVQEEQIPTVWYIEFSNHLVADSIAESTGTQTAMFHTCHNVSQAELDAGATYVSLMEQNLETLKQYMKR